MTSTSSAQARQPSSASAAADSIHESGSFAAHLRTLERKFRCAHATKTL